MTKIVSVREHFFFLFCITGLVTWPLIGNFRLAKPD